MIFKLIDENTEKEYCLDIPDLDQDFFDNEMDDKIYEFINDNNLESTYGVLDGTAGEDWAGYSSYEIEPKDFPKVLEMFQNFFEKEGYDVDEQ